MGASLRCRERRRAAGQPRRTPRDRVVGHEFIVYDDTVQLFYLYKTQKPMKAMASSESVQPVGDEWTVVYLNRDTGEKRESMEGETH